MESTINYGNLQEGLSAEGQHTIRELFPDFDLSGWIDRIIAGENPVDTQSLIHRISWLFRSHLHTHAMLLFSILALTFLSAMLERMSESFESKGIRKMTFFLIFSATSALLASGLSQAMERAREAVESMVFFMHYDTLAMATLSISSGSVTSATTLYSMIQMTLSGIGTLMEKALFPLIALSSALAMLHHIAGNVHLLGMSKLCQSAAKWLLGMFSTFFLSLIALTGIAVSAFDGIRGKTAKFAVGSMIPLVGNTLSEAMETVIGSAVMIKNAVGVVGMLILLGMVASPVMEIGVIALLYRIAAAVSETMGSKRSSELIGAGANALLLLFGTVALLAVFLLISIAIMLCATNLGYAMR